MIMFHCPMRLSMYLLNVGHYSCTFITGMGMRGHGVEDGVGWIPIPKGRPAFNQVSTGCSLPLKIPPIDFIICSISLSLSDCLSLHFPCLTLFPFSLPRSPFSFHMSTFLWQVQGQMNTDSVFGISSPVPWAVGVADRTAH